jgi:hypothetical protein
MWAEICETSRFFIAFVSRDVKQANFSLPYVGRDVKQAHFSSLYQQ